MSTNEIGGHHPHAPIPGKQGGTASRSHSINSFAANAALAAAARIGFYMGIGWLTTTVAVVVWAVILIYLFTFFDAELCLRLAGRPEPMPDWIWTGFDVLIAVDLVAADAHLTAAGWVMSAVVYHLIKFRGRI